MEEQKPNKFAVPMAIVIAGIIIAGAIYYNRKAPSNTAGGNQPSQNQAAAPASPEAFPPDNLKPIINEDHVLGNPNAPVTVVTFTDLECPFCKNFHQAMKQVMNEYGKTGKVKWILRNFPLVQLHSKAKDEAIAAECAGDLGGNEKFWQYLDRVFEITPSNNGLDPLELPKIAEYVGLDKAKFQACLTSGKFDQLIKDNSDNAIQSGAMGTPYSVVIGANGKKSVIPGALPYSEVKKTIDEALK